jgi:hypothetical protein
VNRGLRRFAIGSLAGSAMLVGMATAHGEIIELKWTQGGRFERSLAVAPGKFAELCGPLQAGQRVQWSFESDRALNFNIHYHVGKDVHYPAKQDQVERAQGELAVDSRQDYCWMWVNKTGTAARLAVSLTRH